MKRNTFVICFLVLFCSTRRGAANHDSTARDPTQYSLLNESWQNISTPNFPFDYNNREDKRWFFELPQNQSNVEVIVDGNTESCCDFLWLLSSDGSEEGERELRKRSGSVVRLPEVFNLGSAKYLIVQFTSDHSVTARGFQVSLRSASGNVGVENYTTSSITTAPTFTTSGAVNNTTPFCGFNATLSSDWTNITTPNYPGSYSNDARCKWSLIVPDNSTVEVSIVYGEIESCCDFFEISKVTAVNSSQLTVSRLKGLIRNLVLTIEQAIEIQALFHSDGSVTLNGLSASFRLVQETSTTNLPPTSTPSFISTPTASGCGFDADLSYDWTRITSPNYPRNYPDSISCRWVLKVPDNSSVHILIEDGQTENCCDYFEISKMNPYVTRVVKKFGEIPRTDLELDNVSGQLLVYFYSDVSVNHQGFSASFRLAAVEDDVDAITLIYPEISTDQSSATEEDFSGEGSASYVYTTTVSTPIPSTSTNSSSISQRLDGACGFNATLSYEWTNVTTPNYPVNYPNNARCHWLLQLPVDASVEILLSEGETESCCDSLQIERIKYPIGLTSEENDQTQTRPTYPNNKNLPVMLLTKSGQMNSQRFVFGSHRGALQVLFNSDGSVTKRGFLASFRLTTESPQNFSHYSSTPSYTTYTVDLSTAGSTQSQFYPSNSTSTQSYLSTSLANCGFNAELSEQWLNISTPGWPVSNYPNDANCEWNVEVKQNVLVEIRLNPGSTESCCDNIRLSHSSEENVFSTLIGSRSGRIDYPETLTKNVSKGFLKFIFTSDGSVIDRGYSWSVRVAQETEQEETTTYAYGASTQRAVTAVNPMRTVVCGYNASLSYEWTNISTPNYPNDYSNDARCDWSLYVPETSSVQVLWQEGRSERCCDSLRVTKVNRDGSFNEPFIANGDLPSQYMTFEKVSGSLFVTFRSDGSVTDRGFSGSFRLIPEVEDQINVTVPQTTIQTTTQVLEMDNSCRIGLSITGEFSFSTSSANTTTCRVNSLIRQPACVQFEATILVLETPVSISYGFCADESVCHFFKCDQLLASLTNQNLPFALDSKDILRCSVSCCNSDGSCINGTQAEANIPSTTPPSSLSPALNGLKDYLVLGGGIDYQLLPGCTITEAVDGLLLCSTLFLNDYPYKNSRGCSNKANSFVRCVESRFDLCLEGSRRNIIDGLVNSNASSYILQYNRNETKNTLMTWLRSLNLVCSEEGRININQTIDHLLRVLEDQTHPFDTTMMRIINNGIELKKLLPGLLKPDHQLEFCRSFLEVKSKVLVIYDIFVDLMIGEYGSTYSRLLGLGKYSLENLHLPMCLAQRNNSVQLGPELEILFVVQGSGYDTDEEFNSTLSFIQNVVSHLRIDQLKMGLVLFSKYIKRRSLKKQPFIKTEITLDTFTTLTDFESALQAVQVHQQNASEAYIGRAIKKSLNDDLRSSLVSSTNPKLLFVVANDRASDSPMLKSMAERIQRSGAINVIAVGLQNALESEMKMLAPENGSNKVVMASSALLIEKATVEEISQRVKDLIGKI